jgi:hypothetical protein
MYMLNTITSKTPTWSCCPWFNFRAEYRQDNTPFRFLSFCHRLYLQVSSWNRTTTSDIPLLLSSPLLIRRQRFLNSKDRFTFESLPGPHNKDLSYSHWRMLNVAVVAVSVARRISPLSPVLLF